MQYSNYKNKYVAIFRTIIIVLICTILLVGCDEEPTSGLVCPDGMEVKYRSTNTDPGFTSIDCPWPNAVDIVVPGEGGLCCVPEEEEVSSDNLIIDLRCQRERIIKPHAFITPVSRGGATPAPIYLGPQFASEGGIEYETENPYARDCCVQDNTEEEIECMGMLYPSTGKETGLFGEWGANIFKTDIKFTKESLPSLIRLIFMLPFAINGILKLFLVWRATDVWFRAVWVNAKDDMKNAQKHFTNALVGTFVSVGGIFIVALVFYVAGYRGDVFDFGEDVNRLTDVDCEAIKDGKTCEKYNLSCRYSEWNEDYCDTLPYPERNPACQKELKKCRSLENKMPLPSLQECVEIVRNKDKGSDCSENRVNL